MKIFRFKRGWSVGVLLILSFSFLGIHASLAQDKSASPKARFTPLQKKWFNQALELLLKEKEYQGIDLRTQLVPRSVKIDKFKIIHIKFNQKHPQGIPVFKKRIGVHIKDNKISFVSGHFEKGLEGVQTRPGILEREAVDKTQRFLEEKGSREIEFESSELVILGSSLSLDKKPHLVWHVMMTEPIHRWNVFADANTGRVIYQYDEVCTGTGSGDYTGGDVSFETYFDGFKYLMQDVDRNISTYSAEYEEDLKDLSLYQDGNDYWGDVEDQKAAVDAHVHGKWFQDYYYNELERDGVDGSGGPIKLVVHYGSGFNNAFWNGTYAVFGDGDGIPFSSFATLDVVGHELTHGVVGHTAGLVYDNESGGLNEAYADIFGTCIEFYAQDNGYGTADWWHGEDYCTPGTSGDARRYMDDPTRDGNSIDHYAYYNDDLNVHYSSWIANNAFYLLSHGGTNGTSGLSVTGIGIDAAAQIFYRALIYYLEPDSTFEDAELATLQSASDIYGDMSGEYDAVGQAWEAVRGSIPIKGLEDFANPGASLSEVSFRFIGDNSGDYSGYSVVSAGDVDGDGLSDILIGAYLNDDGGSDGGSDAGKTYLVLACPGVDIDSDVNYVTNPSAEDGLTGWTSYGQAMVSPGLLEDPFFVLVSDSAYMIQDITIPSGAGSVQMSAQVRALRSTTTEGYPYLYIAVLDGGGTFIQGETTEASTSTTWTTVSTQIDDLDEDGVTLRVFLKRSNIGDYSDINRAMFDDIEVTFSSCDL